METYQQFKDSFNRRFDEILENDEIINQILEFETISLVTEKSQVDVLTSQIWGDADCKHNDSEDDCKKKVEAVYQKARTLVDGIYKKFERGLKRIASKFRNAKVLVNIKQMDAFVEKVVMRGKSAANINDVLRAAVLATSDEDVQQIVKGVRKDFTVVEDEFKGKKEVVTKTYDKKGRAQTSKSGGDDQYGYHGSYHFLLKIDGINVELQVMTTKLWSYKEAAHKIYADLRAGGMNVDEALVAAKKKLSKQIFNWGNKANQHHSRRARAN